MGKNLGGAKYYSNAFTQSLGEDFSPAPPRTLRVHDIRSEFDAALCPHIGIDADEYTQRSGGNALIVV